MTTTWNPSDKSPSVTLSGGNLVASFAGINQGVRAVDRVYTGKYYYETTFTTPANTLFGLCIGDTSLTLLGASNTANRSVILTNGGIVFLFGASTGIFLASFSAGGVACTALDATSDRVWFRNGAAGLWNNSASANPATGIGGLDISALSSGPMGLYPCAQGGGGTGVLTTNFGASAFAGVVPSGFTSGFPDSTTLVNAAVITQAALEQWSQGAPVAQLTQAAIEQWAVLGVANPLAVVSQVGLEQWAVVQAAAAAAVDEQYAVSVIT